MTSQDEAALASFFARPEYPRIRPLIEGMSPGVVAKIDALVRKVRVEQWRDFSDR